MRDCSHSRKDKGQRSLRAKIGRSDVQVAHGHLIGSQPNVAHPACSHEWSQANEDPNALAKDKVGAIAVEPQDSRTLFSVPVDYIFFGSQMQNQAAGDNSQADWSSRVCLSCDLTLTDVYQYRMTLAKR